MQLRFSEEDEAFRREFADWLAQNLRGEFEAVRGRGGPGDENAFFDERLAWEKRLGEAGWTCIAWPEAHGGRGASLAQQVVYHEEYARAGGPGRVGHIGETLLGPTLIAFGTEAQQQRFLPAIQSGEELWCQGYSEPNAGSDLANVQTRARLEDDAWVLDGQKVWTSLAEWSQWAFVLCRTDPEAPKHKGLSYLLVPMDQPGVEIRPIQQITGDSEFSETFFDGARTDAAMAMMTGIGTRQKLRMLPFAGHEHILPRHEDILEDANAGRLTITPAKDRGIFLGPTGGACDYG